MPTKKIVGVTFPVPYHFMKRFFEEGKTVFIKNSKLRKIEPNMKLIFYASHKIHAFVGEGTIQKIDFLSPQEVIKKYEKDLFLTKEECMKYANQITPIKKYKVSKFLTLLLTNIKEYPKPVKPSGYYITVAGRYVSESEYENIISKVK